jgi:hypothetical protein
MKEKDIKSFSKEFKRINNEIKSLLIKYGATDDSFYVVTVGIKQGDFMISEEERVQNSIDGIDNSERVDVFYATNVTDEEILEEILDGVYEAYTTEIIEDRKKQMRSEPSPPEKGSTTADYWINLN